MPAPQRVFRLANEFGGPGLTCDETGLHLGGAPLLRRTDAGFEPRPAYELEALIAKAYSGAEDGGRLTAGLRVVADCLNKGELARAMIAALHMQLPDLDPEGADGIAKLDALLRKYDPNEPRDRRGRWTTGASGVTTETPVSTSAEKPTPTPTPVLEASPDAHLVDSVFSGDSIDLTDIAYNGKFHDEVVADIAELAREHGAKVVTEVLLKCVNGATTRADLVIDPRNGKPMVVVEVKTGESPSFQPGQMELYPHLLTGWHVWPLDKRMMPLGIARHEILPPMMFAIVYRRNEASSLVELGLDDVGPKWKIPKWAMEKLDDR